MYVLSQSLFADSMEMNDKQTETDLQWNCLTSLIKQHLFGVNSKKKRNPIKTLIANILKISR